MSWSFWPALLMLAFSGALIYFGVWAVRRLSERPHANEARRILEQRFARGEIDAEEFERRKSVLESEGVPGRERAVRL